MLLCVFNIKGDIKDYELSPTITTDMRKGVGFHMPMLLIWNGKADCESGDGVSFAIVGGHDMPISDMTNLLVFRDEESPSNS